MSTLKVNNITDTSGGSSNLEVPGAAKAWVNFVGTGTVSMRDNHNVSSVTDNGTGDYTVNWNNDFANNDYCAVGSAGGTSGIPIVKITRSGEDFAVGSTRLETLNSSGNSKFDNGIVCVAAFGD